MIWMLLVLARRVQRRAPRVVCHVHIYVVVAALEQPQSGVDVAGTDRGGELGERHDGVREPHSDLRSRHSLAVQGLPRRSRKALLISLVKSARERKAPFGWWFHPVGVLLSVWESI